MPGMYELSVCMCVTMRSPGPAHLRNLPSHAGFLYFLEGGGFSGTEEDEVEISPKNMAGESKRSFFFWVHGVCVPTPICDFPGAWCTAVLGSGNFIRFRTAPAEESSADTPAAHFVVIAGIPLKEPVARHGPFVMVCGERVLSQSCWCSSSQPLLSPLPQNK